MLFRKSVFHPSTIKAGTHDGPPFNEEAALLARHQKGPLTLSVIQNGSIFPSPPSPPITPPSTANADSPSHPRYSPITSGLTMAVRNARPAYKGSAYPLRIDIPITPPVKKYPTTALLSPPPLMFPLHHSPSMMPIPRHPHFTLQHTQPSNVMPHMLVMPPMIPHMNLSLESPASAILQPSLLLKSPAFLPPPAASTEPSSMTEIPPHLPPLPPILAEVPFLMPLPPHTVDIFNIQQVEMKKIVQIPQISPPLGVNAVQLANKDESNIMTMKGMHKKPKKKSRQAFTSRN